MSNGAEEQQERRDPLRREVAEMRELLQRHVDEEMPAVRAMMQELGKPEEVRERRIFIDLMLDRERDRKRLRTAIIEKGLLAALIAVALFVGSAVWHELIAAIKLMLGKS